MSWQSCKVFGTWHICFMDIITFYLWVLHPVAHLSNWFFMMPSIATEFQYVNSFIFSFFLTTCFGPYGPSPGEIYSCMFWRIRCIRNSPLKHLIVYLTWRWPVGVETCSEKERKYNRVDVLKLCCDRRRHKELVGYYYSAYAPFSPLHLAQLITVFAWLV
jgi:hypothetical protein